MLTLRLDKRRIFTYSLFLAITLSLIISLVPLGANQNIIYEDVLIDVPNVIVKDTEIRGSVTIAANNVFLKNVKITTNDNTIWVDPKVKTLRIADSSMKCLNDIKIGIRRHGDLHNKIPNLQLLNTKFDGCVSSGAWNATFAHNVRVNNQKQSSVLKFEAFAADFIPTKVLNLKNPAPQPSPTTPETTRPTTTVPRDTIAPTTLKPTTTVPTTTRPGTIAPTTSRPGTIAPTTTRPGTTTTTLPPAPPTNLILNETFEGRSQRISHGTHINGSNSFARIPGVRETGFWRNSGGYLDSNSSLLPAFDSSRKFSGTYSARFSIDNVGTGKGGSFYHYLIPTPATVMHTSFWWQFDNAMSSAGGEPYIAMFGQGYDSSQRLTYLQFTADRRLRWEETEGWTKSASGPQLSANTWYRVETELNTNSNTSIVRVYDTNSNLIQTTSHRMPSRSNIGFFEIGALQGNFERYSSLSSFYFDDVRVSHQRIGSSDPIITQPPTTNQPTTTRPTTTTTIPNNSSSSLGKFGFTYTQDRFMVPKSSGSDVANIHMYGWGSLWPFASDAPSGEADNGATISARINEAVNNGQEVMITACCAPSTFNNTSRAWDLDNSRVRQEREQDYANRVGELIRRHRGQIKYVQVWNEMKGYWNGNTTTGWDAVSYTRLYNLIYRAVKAADPNVLVAGGYVQVQSRASTGNDRMYNGVALDYRDINTLQYWISNAVGFDAIALDAIAQPQDYPRIMEYVRNMPGANNKPIWWAEFYNRGSDDIYAVGAQIGRAMQRGDIALYWAERKYIPNINRRLY